MDVLRKNSTTIAMVTGDLDRGVPFVMSDATPDRYGDIVEAKGWILDEYRKNSIALANHDPQFPCGSFENVRIVGNQLLGNFKPAPAGTSPRIDELRKLLDAGIYGACSVGFLPEEYEPIPGGGRRYKKQRLIECSLVSIPANPNALRISAKALGISEGTIKRLIDRPPVNGSLAQRQQHSALSRSPAERAATARRAVEIERLRAEGRARKAARNAADNAILDRLNSALTTLEYLIALEKSVRPNCYGDFEDHDRHVKVLRQIKTYRGIVDSLAERLCS